MSSADHWYRLLWERHWWWRSRQRFLRPWIARIAAQTPIERILDVGCGDGLFFEVLEQFGTVQGLEPDPSRIADSAAKAKIRVAKLDRDFKIEPPLDLVVMLDVLEHVEDEIGSLLALRRALRPGGKMLLTVPALPWLWSRHDESQGHFRRYTIDRLRTALVNSGFEIEIAQHFFMWTIVPMLFRRMLSPRGAGQEAVQQYRVTIPPAPINAILEALSRAEHRLSRWIAPPIGSSLLAIVSVPRPEGQRAEESGANALSSAFDRAPRPVRKERAA